MSKLTRTATVIGLVGATAAFALGGCASIMSGLQATGPLPSCALMSMPSGVVQIPDDDPRFRPPVLLSQVSPNYTARAMGLGLQGTVLLEAAVMTDGSVSSVCLARGIDVDLDREAVAVVQLWQFDPATRDGQVVPAAVDLEVTFVLR